MSDRKNLYFFCRKFNDYFLFLHKIFIIILLVSLNFHSPVYRTVLFSVLLTILCACGSSYRHESGMIWNTTYHLTYAGSAELADSVLPTLNDVGESLSVFDESSTVSRINDNVDSIVDRHFINVYRLVERIHDISGGAFDPTLSPLIDAWGFGKGHVISADTAAVDSILHFVGLRKTSLHGNIFRKDDARLRINLSAVAKGYGCDRLGDMFMRNGVRDFLIEIGGEIVARGHNPSGKPWSVAIERPVISKESTYEAKCIIYLNDECVATSGNYRNYREENGRTFGHTIDPVTGRPSHTDLISATVIAPSCAEADALATACMAMGSEKALAMLKKTDAAALLILSDETVITTPDFERYTDPRNI